MVVASSQEMKKEQKDGEGSDEDVLIVEEYEGGRVWIGARGVLQGPKGIGNGSGSHICVCMDADGFGWGKSLEFQVGGCVRTWRSPSW